MKKVLAIIASGLMVAFVGCGLLNPTTNDDSVTFTVGAIDSLTISQAGNQTKTITATIKGENEAPTLNSVAIKTSADAAVATTAIDVSYSSPTTSGKEITTTITITVKPAACNGNYKLVVSATSGSATSSQETAFKLVGHDCGAVAVDTVLTSTTATLGAQGSSNGSFLDADAMTAYLSSAATTHQADVDLQFGSYSSNPTFMSPQFAAANFTGSVAANWTTKNATTFVKAPSGTNINNLDSLSEVRAIWNAGTAADNVTVALNDVIICLTNQGYPVAIGITAVSGTGSSMDLTVKGYHR